MRKRFSAWVVLTLLGTLVTNPASAAVKAGSTCSKVNQKSVTSGYTYTCLKSGKKLTWVKGEKVSSAVANPVSPITPTPTPTPTPKYPLLSPVEGPYSIAWANLVEKFNDISAAAWLDAQATIKRNQEISSSGLDFSSYISPGAKLIDPIINDAEQLLKRNFSLFARFPHYSKVYFVATTTEEREETENHLVNSLKVSFINQSIDAMFGINSNSPAGSVFSAPKCNGNDSGRNTYTLKEAAVIVGVCPPLNGRDNHLEGIHAMAHEYIHMIQSAFAPGRPHPKLPCWMIEGEPEWGQAAVSENFSDYLKVQHLHPYRLTQSGLNYEGTEAREWSTSEVSEYLSESLNTTTCSDTNEYAYSYSLGAATTEVLVSIGGSESIFALHQRIIDAMPYEKAFKEVYGISWEEALPILSQVVAKKITLAWGSTSLAYQTKP